ncbi:MAG: PAS domain S-box protein [Chitinophagaceae bacterium]
MSFTGNLHLQTGYSPADRKPDEEHLAHEKIRYLSMLLENVSDIIISYDKERRIVSWNKAAGNVYGFTAGEAAGKTLQELLGARSQGVADEWILEEVMRTGAWTGESVFVNRFGKSKTLSCTITLLHTADGDHSGFLSVSRDITDKKEAEEQLKKSELFFRNLIAESADGIVITNENGIISFAAPSDVNILGYRTEELTGRHVFEFVHPAEMAKAMESFSNALKGIKKDPYINLRLRKSDGQWLWCSVRAHNMFENPIIGSMVIYFHDNTVPMRALSELRNQAITLSNVFDLIITCDFDYRVLSWNKRAEQVVGYKEEEVLGKFLGDITRLTYEGLSSAKVAAILDEKGYWQGEISFLNREGVRKTVLHTASYLLNEAGERTAIIGTGIDITEKKMAEEKMHQSEVFYRTLAENSFDGIILTDESGILKNCGPSITKISGYRPEELTGRNIFEFVHPEDSMLAIQSFFTEVNKESVLNYLIIRLRHATRGWVWCLVRAHNLLEDPVLRSIVIYFTDDTKRKEIEDKLRESETRFRNMIHNLRLGIVLRNEKGEMLTCNQSAIGMLGFSEEKLLHTGAINEQWDIIHEDGSSFTIEEYPVNVVLRSEQTVKDVVMGLFRPAMNDRVWLLVNATPVFNDEGKLINVISSYADITEQRRMSQALIQQEIQKQKLITQATIDGQERERLEIGKELHDNINQHLTTTRLYLEVTKDKCSGEVQELVNLAHKNLSDIVSEIRRLSQSLVPPTLGDIGLTESVQELCESLKRVHSFSMEFTHHSFAEKYLPDNMKLMIFRIIQEQVSNIIRHAKANKVRINLESDHRIVRFSIADDGQGFDPQRYKKGMGLSNISNRASLFGGRMQIDSSPGKGCTITVTIPLHPVSEHELI